MENVVVKLTEECNANAASKAVFHVFALRGRTRNCVMLNSLYHKMKHKGFLYQKDQYLPVLKSLANLKLGELILDSRGQIRGLKNISYTLQSIGKVAIGKASDIIAFESRVKYEQLALPTKVDQAQTPAPCSPPQQTLKSFQELSLKMIINGKPLFIPVPDTLTIQDIAVLISKLKSA